MTDEGRFQVGVGVVLKHEASGKILLIHRHVSQYGGDIWELPFGRLKQFEPLADGLRREVAEETGIADIKIGSLLRAFEYMRGEHAAQNEVIGLVFAAITNQPDVRLSPEHDDYKWLTIDEAVDLAVTPGIKKDLLAFKERELTTTIS